MPWSGCGTTSEFIELMNFGPGPMDIGCYIVTNGQYAVTIPPNTILQPGQYYVLAGQNTLAKNCGNTDSIVRVDLNWTTCNCTDKPVPATGDGFLQNGGSANEKIVLLDPNLNVVDAVSRSSTPSSSLSITTSSISGACTGKTFDLDLMAINYESINNSTGIDNSFARRVDGDCGWVKTTAISAHAPNKTGSTSSASYEFNTVSASECAGTAGKVSISVSAPDISSLFPMNYTLGYDSDSNNVFNTTDNYVYGVDSSASSIDINNLAYGRYRITVGSFSGCNLKSYDFFIFNCYGVVLPLKLVSFRYEGVKDNQHLFQCRITGPENLKTLVLEGSRDGFYQPVTAISTPATSKDTAFILKAPPSPYTQFRLRMVDKSGIVSYSQVVKTGQGTTSALRHWPNPVKDNFFIQMTASRNEKMSYRIFNSNGNVVDHGSIDARSGTTTLSFSAAHLPPGLYHLQVIKAGPGQAPVSFRFVKH